MAAPCPACMVHFLVPTMWLYHVRHSCTARAVCATWPHMHPALPRGHTRRGSKAGVSEGGAAEGTAPSATKQGGGIHMARWLSSLRRCEGPHGLLGGGGPSTGGPPTTSSHKLDNLFSKRYANEMRSPLPIIVSAHMLPYESLASYLDDRDPHARQIRTRER